MDGGVLVHLSDTLENLRAPCHSYIPHTEEDGAPCENSMLTSASNGPLIGAYLVLCRCLGESHVCGVYSNLAIEETIEYVLKNVCT